MKSNISKAILMLAAGSTLAMSGCVRQPGANDSAPQISNATPPAAQTSTTGETSTETAIPSATETSNATTGSNAASTNNPTRIAAYPIGTRSNLPVNFPLPKYPMARVITSQEVPKQQQLAMLLTQDQPPKVAQYYRGALAQQGWSIQNTRSNIRAVPGTEVLTALKPGAQAVVSITRNDTLTRIDIVITSLRH
ncbi:MAG TPA: hypothetical protein V6C69_04350 [Trichormus sp.]|jgi:hypothetical protein